MAQPRGCGRKSPLHDAAEGIFLFRRKARREVYDKKFRPGISWAEIKWKI